MVPGMRPMESASYMGLTSLRLIFIKVLEDYLKFQLFQIDSLAENFCLLDYAHTAVHKRPICFAIFITRSPHLLVEGPSGLLTLSFIPRWSVCRDFQLIGTGTALMTSCQKVSFNWAKYISLMCISGVWRQYDEELLSWSPWWFDEHPYGGTGWNCGRVGLREDHYAGQWASQACRVAYHYICERNV